MRLGLVLLVGACASDPAPIEVQGCVSPLAVTFGEMGTDHGGVDPIAVGGRESLRPRWGTEGNELGGIDHYSLEVIASDAFEVDQPTGPASLVGLSPGDGTLQLTVHGQVYPDTYPVVARTVDHVIVTPSGAVIGRPWAWAPGHRYYTLQGFDEAGLELRDEGRSTSFPTEQSDSSLLLDQVGEFTLHTHFGTLDTEVPFAVVDTADTIAATYPPASIAVASYTLLCFEADNAGRDVIGLTWAFTVDGVAAAETGSCVDVYLAADHGPTVAIAATAGGATTTLTLPVQ